MRLNPFSRPKGGARDAPEDDDSSAEEDIAITRLKNNSRYSSGRNNRRELDSLASSGGRGRAAASRSVSRGGGRSTSPSLRTLPPGAQAVVRGRSKGGRRDLRERDDASSSPEPAPSRGRSARGKRRSMAPRGGRDASSSPEPEMSARGGGSRRGGLSSSVPRRSRSSRPSRPPPSSPSSDSDESGPERMSSSRAGGQLKRSSSRAASRRSNSSRPREGPPTIRRPSSSRRLIVDDDDDDDVDGYPRRGRVALSRSRSYNSRRAASLAPPPSRSRRASYGAPERRRSSSRAAPYQRRSLSQAPIRRTFREEEPAAPEKPKKRGFKALFGLKNKFKKQDTRDDDDGSSLESIDPPSDQQVPPPPPPAAAAAASERQAPEVDNAVVDSYVVPKRETYANLYEYDNFPAIDRVPTAIGYQSDDSKDEVYIGGTPVPVADDDKSVTSRYSVDVRSVRSSKMKRYAGDPDSDNDNDDKYSQYLSGNNTDAIHSDDSDSCRPQWHHTLDLDDSDWYDDDDDDDDAMNKVSKHQRENKKYQVSGNRKKKKTTHQEKGEPSSEDKGGDEGQEENPGDAIVANRSEEKEGNRVPRQKEIDDEQGLNEDNDNGLRNRRRHRRGGKGGRRSRFDEDTMDDDDDDDESLSDDDDYGKSRKAKGRRKHQQVLKEKGIIMNNNHGKGNTKASKKGKMKGFANRFKAFGRRNAGGYASDGEESESENIGLTPNQSMYSEEPSWRYDPTLTKLEEDERRVSTATHNMIRANRKEISELDEMDEMSLGSNANQASCFPFSLAAFNGTSSAPQQASSSFCFYPSTGQGDNMNDFPLDDVQIQRLKDNKYDVQNKPKVEVILQDLQDPLAERYEQLEKDQRKKKSEMQKQRELQEQNEQREREELLRRKREMREMEQKKLQMLQHKDALALQEAPDLKRGKNQSFVMDISDWVLNLDNDTPRKSSAKDTPRTNGRDSSTDPVEKLPFSTIEVPTTTTLDSGDITESAAGSSWGGRRKKRHDDEYSQQYSQRRPRSSSKPKAKKKKGWFRRG